MVDSFNTFLLFTIKSDVAVIVLNTTFWEVLITLASISIFVPDSIVISPIAEIVLVVIPFTSVIVSIVTLLPAVNLSCFVSSLQL